MAQHDWHEGADDGRRGPTAGAVLLVTGLLFLAFVLGTPLLLLFGAIVVAVGLDGLARMLARYTPLGRGIALLIVLLAVLAGLAAMAVTIAPQVARQFAELWTTLIDFGADVRQRIYATWAEDLMDSAETPDIGGMAQTMLGWIGSWGLTAIGGITSLMIVAVMGAFLAANPDLYIRGVVRLVPPARREQADHALSSAAYALRWWFLGQLASMAILGVTVGVGLYFIGIELWLSLALLTALLTFIPYLGPVIAGIPIVIVGFTAGIQTGLIVLGYYLVIQNIEGNILTPLIYQKAVSLPPALSILVQIVMGTVFGIAGFVLAAPLTVVGMVLVQKLYVEAVLGERAGI